MSCDLIFMECKLDLTLLSRRGSDHFTGKSLHNEDLCKHMDFRKYLWKSHLFGL